VTEEEEPFGDPLTAPFWEAARRHQLIIQRCSSCGHYQFYPRPFCLKCLFQRLEWVSAKGTGTIYSGTTVRLKVLPEIEPPFGVALVDLDEGPRFFANVPTLPVPIGARVRIGWRDRPDGPPLLIAMPEERR
jgi:uncharacterized OB-fold protein